MGKSVKQLYLIGDEETARFFSLQIPAKRFGPVKEARTSFLSFQFAPIDDLTASRFLVCYDEITERAQGKSIVVMSNWDSQCIDTGFIATGKHQRGNNYFTTNEVEDDFLNTQGENSPISTQPNLNFAQEPSPIHLSISASRREEKQPLCASIEKKSDQTAIHNEEFSVSAAVKTVQQLQGFSTGDIAFAITMFIDNARVCEAFLSCNEETRAPLIKAMIDQHKAKEKRPREELEHDANQNQTQSKLRRISSMKIGRKRQWEELNQDANQNQPQSKLVRMISSMKNQPQSCQMRVGMIRIFKARSALRFAFIMIGISKRQYDIEDAVPTLQTQPLRIKDLPTPKIVFANQVPRSIYASESITDNNKMPIEIQLIDINTGRQCTNVEGWNKKAKIVVIDGDLELEDLDSNKFNSNIVKQREGKRPLLIGNTEVTFNQQGIGNIGEICFTDNSKWLRSGKFRLGACIDSKRCGTSIKIQEGLSEKFSVKDGRGLLHKKHHPPMLNDDVWRLEGIGKDGIYHQRLKDKKVNSVEDFLKLLNANPSALKEILKMPTNPFKKLVEHAKKCPTELDNANFENNADLPKSPGLESFTLPNPMPEFQPENKILKMPTNAYENVVKHAQMCPMELDNSNFENNADLPKSPGPELPNPMPEVQQENMGMGKQVAPELNLVSDQMERFPSNASFNGNNEPISSNLHEDELSRELLEDTTITPGFNRLGSIRVSDQCDDNIDFSFLDDIILEDTTERDEFLDGGSTF